MSNFDLCEAARAGEVSRIKELLANGENPDGDWDPVEAQGRQESRNRYMRSKYEEMIRDGEILEIPEFLKEALGESFEVMESEMFSSEVSAPSSYEIPLFCAVEADSVYCVLALIDAGADVHKRDNSSQTALYYAFSEKMIHLLVEKGLPLEDRDKYDWSPLDNAVTDGMENLTQIKALIAAGADVNATHDRGFTVFMSATGTDGRDPEVLNILVQAGADPFAITELGYNAFHTAIDVSGESNEEQSVRSILTCLKQLGVDLEHRNHADQTPLAYAIERGTGTEVRVLCELGANPNAVYLRQVCGDDECPAVSSPLIFAAISSAVDSDEKLKSLLSVSVNIEVVDEEKLSPREHAMKRLDELVCSEQHEYTKEWIQETKRCIELLEKAESPPR